MRLTGPFDNKDQARLEARIQRHYESGSHAPYLGKGPVFLEMGGKIYSYFGHISKPCRKLEILDEQLEESKQDAINSGRKGFNAWEDTVGDD